MKDAEELIWETIEVFFEDLGWERKPSRKSPGTGAGDEQRTRWVHHGEGHTLVAIQRWNEAVDGWDDDPVRIDFWPREAARFATWYVNSETADELREFLENITQRGR